jgi:hypothetical protein
MSDASPAPDAWPTMKPADGSLGLLAMGYRGIMLWREARAQSGWTAKSAAAAAKAVAPPREKKPAGKPSAEGQSPAAEWSDGLEPGVDPDAMIPFMD